MRHPRNQRPAQTLAPRFFNDEQVRQVDTAMGVNAFICFVEQRVADELTRTFRDQHIKGTALAQHITAELFDRDMLRGFFEMQMQRAHQLNQCPGIAAMPRTYFKITIAHRGPNNGLRAGACREVALYATAPFSSARASSLTGAGIFLPLALLAWDLFFFSDVSACLERPSNTAPFSMESEV